MPITCKCKCKCTRYPGTYFNSDISQTIMSALPSVALPGSEQTNPNKNTPKKPCRACTDFKTWTKMQGLSCKDPKKVLDRFKSMCRVFRHGLSLPGDNTRGHCSPIQTSQRRVDALRSSALGIWAQTSIYFPIPWRHATRLKLTFSNFRKYPAIPTS